MGLATIDPHSHKVQTKLYKIPKFSVNRPNSKQDIAFERYLKDIALQRNEWPCGRCPNTASGWPYISLLILTFFGFLLYLSQKLVRLTPNLGIL